MSTRNDGKLMLRNRNRLSKVGVVVLGTIVSANPQSYAQQLGLQLNSGSPQSIPGAPNIGGSASASTTTVSTTSASRTRSAPAKKVDPNKPYSPARLDIGGSGSSVSSKPLPTAMPGESILIREDESELETSGVDEGISLQRKRNGAPKTEPSRTSRSILLEFGEEEADRAPFGLMARGAQDSASSISKTPKTVEVGSRQSHASSAPTITIPAPPAIGTSPVSESGRPALHLGAHAGPISEPIDIDEEIESYHADEMLELDELDVSNPESEQAIHEPLLLEFPSDAFDNSHTPDMSHLGMTETMKDVFVKSGESETDLLDVDPGLPEVDPSLVEDVSIAEIGSEEAVAPDLQLDLNDAGAEKQEQTLAPVINKRTGRPVRTPLSVRELGGIESSGVAPIVSPYSDDEFEVGIDETKEASEDQFSDTASRSHLELQKELQQEAPIIDVRNSQSRRDEQGVDALLATKPVSMKREASNGAIVDASVELPPIVSATQLPALNAAESQRLIRTNACLSYYLSHPESTSVRSPWAVMHALLAFGPDYELQHGDSRVNAIGWMCHNGTCRTQRMFTPKGQGFVPNVGAGVQGHEGQFLAILAQSNVPLDYPIQIGTNKFRVEDLVRYEMATCRENSELTFKLIALSYYLDSEKQWKANDGKVWSIQKLIQQELAQPVVGAACGGTHRLMGFSFAVRQRAMQGQPITGQFARANQFVKSYIDYTWKLQNPDGSFSTSWYEGRGNEPNNERKVQTTGHMLEWLMYTLPDAEINQPRVQRSIDFILSNIYDNKEHKWPIGPRGHATRAIALYQARYQEILNSAPELLQATQSIAESRTDNNLTIPMIEGSGAPRFTSANVNANGNQAPNASRATSTPSRSARANLLQPPRIRGGMQRR